MVQEAIARERAHDTICGKPPAYDPQASGGAERAVAEVKAQMRAVRIRHDMRIKKTVDPRWAILGLPGTS